MNAPARFELPDIQAQVDTRNLAIEAVGIKGLRYPISIRSAGAAQPTIGTFAMTIGLDAQAKGTHMSRFIEVLEGHEAPLDFDGFRTLVFAMLARLQARTGEIELRFPYFVAKAAPVSGVVSRLDYEVCWRGRVTGNMEYAFRVCVLVPATSLCPCSKEISEYGAHNQRSHITIEAELSVDLSIEELVGFAERSASCELYGLLKRADEKFVTERAYDNPKFVEDLVRDTALALRADPRVRGFTVEAENFESIHNHSAVARIVHAMEGAG